MKIVFAVFSLCICVCLMLFSSAAALAAQEALELWWRAVLPVLFPFFVCSVLIEKSGLMEALANKLRRISEKMRIHPYALPVFLLSGLCGYPAAGRLCGGLSRSGGLDAAHAERFAILANLCSPMFLLGTLSLGMLKDRSLFFPLAIGHYGGALLTALIVCFLAPLPAHRSYPRIGAAVSEPSSLPGAIWEGVQGMLRIGGSIVFFYVLIFLIKETGLLRYLAVPFNLLFGLLGAENTGEGFLCGLFEMTSGCKLLSSGTFPLQWQAALCCFLISFSGLCIYVQTLSFMPFRHPKQYLGVKALHALFASSITYFTYPMFPSGAVETLATGASSYLNNAISGFSVIAAAALGIGFTCLLSIWLYHKNGNRVRDGKLLSAQTFFCNRK